MDIEQLTLILDAARAAGDGAMQVVFIWFAYKFAALAVGGGLGVGALYGVYRLIKRAIDGNSFVDKVANITMLDFHYDSRRERFLDWLRENWKSVD